MRERTEAIYLRLATPATAVVVATPACLLVRRQARGYNGIDHPPVDAPVRFEDNHSLLAQADGQEFLRIGSSARAFSQTGKLLFHLRKDVIGLAGASREAM